jgi:hypothetical protein
VRTLHRCDRASWSCQLDARHSLPSEDVEEKFARRTAQPNRGCALPRRDPLFGSFAADLQPDLAQPPTQVAATSANVAPQGSLQCGREGGARAAAVRSAHVLVVDEELIQVRHGADPSDSKESGRWSRPGPLDQPSEISLLRHRRSASLAELLECSRKDEARTSDEVTLAQHGVGSEVLRGPVVEQRGYVRPEFFEEVAERKAPQRVEVNMSIAAGQYGRSRGGCRLPV